MSIERELEEANARVKQLTLAKARKDAITEVQKDNPHVAAYLCQNPLFLQMFRAKFGFDAGMTAEDAADLILTKMQPDVKSDSDERLRKRAMDKWMADLVAKQKEGMQQKINHNQTQAPPQRVLTIKYQAIQGAGFTSVDRDEPMQCIWVKPSEYMALWAKNSNFKRDLGVLAIRELKHRRGVAYAVYSQFGGAGRASDGYIHDCAYDKREVVVRGYLQTALFRHLLDALHADPNVGDMMTAYIGGRLMREIRSKTTKDVWYPIVFTTKRMVDEYALPEDKLDTYKYPILQGGWTEKDHGYDQLRINYKFIRDLKSMGDNTPTKIYKLFNNEGHYMDMFTDIARYVFDGKRSTVYQWLDDRFRFLVLPENI